MRPLRLLCALLALGTAVPALAQQAGAVDIGIYGRITRPDPQLSDEIAMGGGGRFGLFMMRKLALELDASQTESGKDVYSLFQPISVRLAYHQPLGDKWSGILGAGWVHGTIDPPDAGGPYADDGATVALGLQRRITERMSFRFDAVLEQYMSPIRESPVLDIAMSHVGLQAGLNWRFNDKPKDTDGDGVADRLDACAGTPAGKRVDARGCIPDSDGDGVDDSIDACAGTPAGTRVNPRGCIPDSDGDGIDDTRDGCPNTPAGTRVNPRGCIPDSDGDGVNDASDACANTAPGARVDASGCPVPVDTDGDGVMDNADRCANTPAGTRVDANGCALADTDGDGIFDNADACANTPRGTPVDSRGCARVFEEGQKNIVLEGVTFNSGSAILTPGAKVVLDRMAVLLNGAPDVKVEVQGHTDNTGSAASNTRISQLRAEAVRTYLITKSVNAARLTARGYGPTVPVADNATPAGRAQNRRVEFKRTN